MKNYPPFSVLMSLYIKEQPEFLDQCLSSLFEQSIKASEIIIVLDGPINKELQNTLEQWTTLLPLIILPQEINKGLGVALNIGLKASSHEIVFRMDTDDICLPHRFKKQLDHLKSHPDVDILGCYVEEFNSKPGDLKQIKTSPTASLVEKYITYRNPINHMGVAYKKSKILKAGGYQHFPFMEDYYLWIKCFSKNIKIDNLQEVLVYARIGNGMLSRRRGTAYSASEKKLISIRRKLLKTPLALSLLIYLIRLTLRMTPNLLAATYKLLRQ